MALCRRVRRDSGAAIVPRHSEAATAFMQFVRSACFFSPLQCPHSSSFPAETCLPKLPRLRIKHGGPPQTAQAQLAPAKPRPPKCRPLKLKRAPANRNSIKRRKNMVTVTATAAAELESVSARLLISAESVSAERKPDPFAVPAGPQPVTARTEEKSPLTKKPREAAKTDPFAGVQLTGAQAKAETKPLLSGELANDPWSQINPVSKDLSQTARKEPPPAKQNPQPSP